MRNLWSVLAAAAIAATLVAALPAHAASGSGAPPAKAPAAKPPVPPAVGSRFPDFTLPGVDGKPVSLSDFKGKAIMLSFWSCYTDTCFTSVRVMEELLKEHSASGLVAPTVCVEVPPALANDRYAGLLEKCGTGQIVLIDKEMAVAKKLGITEFPTTYLIDRDYAVWQAITGVRPLMTEDFRVLVKSLVSD